MDTIKIPKNKESKIKKEYFYCETKKDKYETLLNILNYLKKHNDDKYVLITTRDNSGNIIYKIIQNKD